MSLKMVAELLINVSLDLLVLQILGTKGLLFPILMQSFDSLCGMRWCRLSDLLKRKFIKIYLHKCFLLSYKYTRFERNYFICCCITNFIFTLGGSRTSYSYAH